MKGRKEKSREFAVCVRNSGYPASLELRKIYEVLPDSEAAAHGLIRMIDASGEDYLYPKTFFARLPLPQPVESAISSSGGLSGQGHHDHGDKPAPARFRKLARA